MSFKQYNDTQDGGAGFNSLRYKKAKVVYDGNSGIPANHMYFLNTNYLKLVAHPDADLTVMDEMRPVNQDGAVTQILWMGNLTISNRKLQAVVVA